MTVNHRWAIPVWAAVVALWALAPGGVAAQSHPPALSDGEAREVRALVDAMRRDERGPYLRIRWFCNDGTVQPPQGTPCRERGGGVQYGEYNPQRARLAVLGIYVGTVLQATPADSLIDRERAHYRLREWVVQHYLEAVDDGWVLRRARYYRGARQIEDEEQRGQALLEQLFRDSVWVSDHYYLAMRLVATVPHLALGTDQLTYQIRNLASEVAQLEPAFLNLRIKIHSFPSRDDLDGVERFLAQGRHAPGAEEKLRALRDALRRQYDPRHYVEALEGYRRRLRAAYGDDLQAIAASYAAGRSAEALGRIEALVPRLREHVERSGDGRTSVAVADLNLALQDLAFVLMPEVDRAAVGRRTRAAHLAALRGRTALAYGAGLLSARERGALDAEIERVTRDTMLTALSYRQSLAYLARGLDWATGTVRGTFGPVLRRYASFEPKAAAFVDAELRASALLPLSAELGRLIADADSVLGASHIVLGRRVGSGVRGLNPGVALRPLEILADVEHADHVDAQRIYALPVTPPELKPVAGVLTLDEGNLLSHVQLLARNLGIPNAAMTPSLLPALRGAAGRQVFFAVSPLGRVVLKLPDALSADERALVEESREAKAERVQLDVSRLDLARWRPVPLDSLRFGHSGVIVGPKAANLGQLAADFPGRVSAGTALPFGMFYRHANRRVRGSERTVLESLADAYRRAAELRAQNTSESEIDRYMFGELARVRQAILELPWEPEVRDAVVTAIRATFGPDVQGGVFIRSDTNVEDLPQFSGAGLNLTVPNQRSVEDVLAAVKRVWTSPFTERAYLWRRQILDEQGTVYPSVLLLESVRSDKSGVLITSGLQFGGPDDLTVVVAEGVGGAVEGEEAETIVVRRDGSMRLLGQAKAFERRTLVTSGAGGVRWMAARTPDTLLQPAELAQLREVVDEWERRFSGSDAGAVWDIEFGFVGGRLWLFQIRPFVRFRNSDLLDRLGLLDREIRANGARRIDLRRVI